MLTHSDTWRWDENMLSPQAWRDPRSGWDVDQILDVMASLSGGLVDVRTTAALVERVLPKRALLEVERLELDSAGALRPTDVTRVDGDLLAWLIEALWGRVGTIDQLLGGWTLARIRQDGLVAHMCVPLVPARPGLTLVACAITAPDRDQILSLASRMTWLTSLSPDIVERHALLEQPDVLTERQKLILRAMARGLTNRQIASRINFSESTVRMESMAIYRLFGVHSRTDAVSAARAAGLLPPHEEVSRRAHA
jgi:DNA-binding CsgD family transcriptional regulator